MRARYKYVSVTYHQTITVNIIMTAHTGNAWSHSLSCAFTEVESTHKVADWLVDKSDVDITQEVIDVTASPQATGTTTTKKPTTTKMGRPRKGLEGIPKDISEYLLLRCVVQTALLPT